MILYIRKHLITAQNFCVVYHYCLSRVSMRPQVTIQMQWNYKEFPKSIKNYINQHII